MLSEMETVEKVCKGGTLSFLQITFQPNICKNIVKEVKG
jgi:hypothetical protein